MGDSKKRSLRVQLGSGGETAPARKDSKTRKRSKNVGSGRDRRTPNERGVAGLPELVQDIQNHLRYHSLPACAEKEKGEGGASSSSSSPSTVHSCTSIAEHTLSVLSLLVETLLSSAVSLRTSQASELSLFLLFLLGQEPPECDGLGKMLGSRQGRLKVWELMTCMIQLTPTSRFSCVSDRIANALAALVAHWQQGPAAPSLCSSFMEDVVMGVELCEPLLRCHHSKVLKDDDGDPASSHQTSAVLLFSNLGKLIGVSGVNIDVTSPSRPEYLLAFLTSVMEKITKHAPQFVVGTPLIWCMWKHLTNQLTSVLELCSENENTMGNNNIQYINQLLSVQLKTMLTFLSLENPPPDCVLQMVSSSVATLVEGIFSESSFSSRCHHDDRFPFSSTCLDYLERLVDVVFICDDDGEEGSHHRTTTTPPARSIAPVLPTVSAWCTKNEELIQQGGLKEKCQLACTLLRCIAKHIHRYRGCSIKLHLIPCLCNMAHVWQLQTPIVDCISAIITHQLPEEVKRVIFQLNNPNTTTPPPTMPPSREKEENLEVSHQSMRALPEWSIVRLIQMVERREEEKDGQQRKQQVIKISISIMTRLTSVIRILLPFLGSSSNYYHHDDDKDEGGERSSFSSSTTNVLGGRLLNLVITFLSSSITFLREEKEAAERCSLLKLEDDCLNTNTTRSRAVNICTTAMLMTQVDCCLTVLQWIPNFMKTLNGNDDDEQASSEGNLDPINNTTATPAVFESLVLRTLEHVGSDGCGGLTTYNNNRHPPLKSSFEIDATTMIQMTLDINDLHYLEPLQRTLVLAFCLSPWSTDACKKLLNRINILLSFEGPEYVQCTTLILFPLLIETYLLDGDNGSSIDYYKDDDDDLVLAAAMKAYSSHLDAFLVSITPPMVVTERRTENNTAEEVKVSATRGVSSSSYSSSNTVTISSNIKACVLHSAYLMACIATNFCLPPSPDNKKYRPVSETTAVAQQKRRKEMLSPSSSLPMMVGGGIRVVPTSCQMQQQGLLDRNNTYTTNSFGYNNWWTSRNNIPSYSKPSSDNVVVPEPDLLLPPPSIRMRRDILKCCQKLCEALLHDCIAETEMCVGALPLVIQLIQCESNKHLRTIIVTPKEEIEETETDDGSRDDDENITGKILRKLLEALRDKGDGEIGNAVALIAGMYVSHESTILKLLNLSKREDLGELIDCLIGFDGGHKKSRSSSTVHDKTITRAEETGGGPLFTPEHQCHLRALGSIGSSADISLEAGRYWVLWSMLRLIHVWVDKSGPFQFMAFDELRRVCQSTCPPVLELFSSDNIPGCEEVLPTLLAVVLKHGKGCTERFLEQILCVRDTRAWIDARLHHILPTLISDRRIDTIEQISVLWDHMHNGELSRMRKVSMARTPPSLGSCLMLRSNTIRCIIKEILLGSVNVKSELHFVVQTFYPQNTLKHFLHEQLEPVLCLVARELGGKRHNAAVKAINRMTSILESPLYPTARDMVRDKFLYLMSHVVAKSSPLRPQLDRHQAMLVLEELVRYFNAEDSACFAPKVFATLSSALADPSARVGNNPIRVTTYRIVCNYTRVLPVAALGTHLSTIVVTLLPALLECEDTMSSKSGSIVRQKALDLLHYLVITQQKTLCTHFCTIPFLPRVPELKHIAAILEEEVGRPALVDQLQQLSKLLQHEESVAVRIALLRHLLQVLRDTTHQGELGELLAPSDDRVDSVIENLLGCLLRISSSSGNVEIRDICGSCLGQIGAVDPSHIPSLRLSEWTAGLPTWGFSTEDLSLLLLREHLVPALRAATSSIDRVAYGIQELVYLMEQSRVDETKKGHHFLASPQLAEAAVHEERITSNNNPNMRRKHNDTMPEWLMRIFREHGILDAVEPFWVTNYILRDSMDPSMQFPIFRAQIISPTGSSLERYISLWCRHLISNSRGPMQPIFKACRGVVRASIGVAQFLLPHLAVDAILFGTESDREDLLNEVVAVLSVDLDLEMGGGGKATTKSFHHVAIQAIFKLLDTLNEWMNGGTPPLGTNWPKPRERLCALRSFMELIPRHVLIDASVGIKAHTRALLYLEEQLRITTRGSCIGTSGGGNQISDVLLNDGANGTLPAITAHSLQQLVDIYRRISSEPDAMSGLEVLRCKFGCPQTLKQRIWQHEHAEEWFEALQVYEHTLQSSRPGSDNRDSSLRVGLWDPGERELGALRCHMSLGQYQLVLHQTNGMLMMPTLSGADRQKNPTTIGSLILPLAIEASWRLQRWSLTEDLLNEYDQTLFRYSGGGSENITNSSSRLTSHQDPPSPLLPEDSFRVSLARVLLLFHKNIGTTASSSCKSINFEGALRTARAEVMGQLAAASMESYQRAYPYLIQLHTLAEIEQVWLIRSHSPAVGVVQSRKQKPISSSSMVTFASLNWSSRLGLLAPNLQQMEPLLAVRQAMLQNERMHDLAVENFLCLGKAARVATCFSVAACALERAGMLDVTDLAKERLVMQEAKLAYARGHIDRALLILEPVNLNVGSVRQQWLSQSSSSDVKGGAMRIKQYNFARRLLWATNWMVESGQCHGKHVVDRYKFALELQPGEKGHFALGQYMDFLLQSRAEEVQDEITRVIGSDELACKYAVETLHCYAECLRHGSKYIFQSMPRLLTLWFEVCALDPEIPVRKALRGQGNTTSRVTAASDLSKTQYSCTAIVQTAMTEVPPYMWYTCMPQLMSRVGHPKDEVVAVVSQALVNIISAHPHQALWQVSGLPLSLSETRRKIGQRIINRATLRLRTEGDAECVKDAIQLFEELIAVAMDKPDSASRGNANYVIGKNINLNRFVVPTQAALTVSLPNKVKQHPPATVSASKSKQKNKDCHLPPRYEPGVIFPRGQMHIRRFWERVRIMPSKAQPKKMSLQTVESGETLHFLCKQERNGDLRKDARLMEFNGVVNRLLARDNAGRRRKLRLRTYSVICLNEECGIIEWVQGTTAFRHLVSEGYRIGPPRKTISNDQLKDLIKRIQEKTGSLEEMVDLYRSQLLPRFPPSLHRWFTEHFREPTAWFDGRTTFTRSAALWSAVGHVVGLGDRHGENLLLHTEGGECVHVDFDCLFDKGLILARPEIVPFRLTPNMVDGMGVTGYEGIFRRVMEVTMQVLRDNRRLLLSVLEPFLQDPTVGWRRIGRAQRPTDEKLGEKDKLKQNRHTVAQDTENEDARRTLRVIEGRLRGVYNVRVPRKRRKFIPLRKGDPRPVHQQETNELPLSVPGQVQRLINESVSHENLCQMYIGW